MTRADLILGLAEKMPHLGINEIELAVKHIFEAMAQALQNRLRIEIRGFGSFSVRHRPSRVARNPKTGEQVFIEAKHAAHFKAGKELRKRVNGESETVYA